jgi:diguanylate cyclase (GGDEF)-like protein
MSSRPPRGSKGTILVVDDTPANLELLTTILTRAGYEVCVAVDGTTGIEGAQFSAPDLILLDIMMPGMNGYDVCAKLKEDETTCDIPVIFISALDDALDKVKAFSAGGIDYISKPFQFKEVLARVENQLTIRSLQQQLTAQNQRLQTEVEIRLKAETEVRSLNEDLEVRVKQRTEELERSNRQLETEALDREHRATHDSLTELPNRTFLMTQLTAALERAHATPGYTFAVLFMDCDRFKLINDSFGHLEGDRVLCDMAKRFAACLKSTERLFRLGGDEFTLLLDPISSTEEAIEATDRLKQALAAPFNIKDYQMFMDASIGITIGSDRYKRPEDLLRDADTAMYSAKETLSISYAVFNDAMREQTIQRLHLEADLRKALERQEFRLFYQPIVALSSGQITGFEALIRWMRPDGKRISPELFIGVAEDMGLILPLGRWILKEACRQMQVWQGQPWGSGLTISVNVSVKQLSRLMMVDEIDEALLETGLPRSALKLEITESHLMDNQQVVSSVLEKLRTRQIPLSIDDFGTGYSSLSYLHRLPVDILKVDRSFVQHMHEDRDSSNIVKAIVSLAHSLNMKVIAEGVETEEHYRMLSELNCEFGQGYWFAKPLSAEDAEQLLRSQPCWLPLSLEESRA